MTLVLAVATSHFGLIAADTRLNIKHADGQWQRNDAGHLHLTRADGSVDVVGPAFRKISRFAKGVIGSAGGSHLLNREILDAIATAQPTSADAIEQIARTVVAERAQGIRAEFANASEDEDRLAVSIVLDEGSQFRLAQFILGVDAPSIANAQFLLSCPPEASEATRNELHRLISERLVIPVDLSGMLDVARHVADVFSIAHQEFESVGPVMEVVMLARTPDGTVAQFYMVGNSQMVHAADNSTLGQLLERIA